MAIVSIKLDGQDNASDKIQRVERNLQGLAKNAPKQIDLGGTAMAAGAAGAVASFAALGLAAAGAVAYGKSAVDAASDLNESLSKTNVIFGESASAIVDWSTTTAASLGMARIEALNAADTFAVFGKAAGLSGENLTGFSTTLTGLAADLASFYNTSPEEAITAIGAALRGEVEPIRAYGVMLDDATLRQKAFDLGITDSINSALTPQQKALAATSAIFQQTADAQGDFERTSGGLANQQRILAATLTDVQGVIGTALLPAMTSLITEANALLTGALPAIASFAETQLAPAIEGIAEAIDPGYARERINEIIGGFESWGNAAIATYNSIPAGAGPARHRLRRRHQRHYRRYQRWHRRAESRSMWAYARSMLRRRCCAETLGARLRCRSLGCRSLPCRKPSVRQTRYATDNALPFLQLDRWDNATRAADDFSEAIRGQGASAVDTADKMNGILRSAENVTSATDAHAKAVAAAEKAYAKLEGAVSSALKGATSLSPIGVDPLTTCRVPMRCRKMRFAWPTSWSRALTARGWTTSRSSSRNCGHEISSGGDIQAGAAKVLQQFQAGMRPDLLNFDTLKQQVRDALLSQAAFADMSKQITDQLVAEMGVSAQEVQSALTGVVGNVPGAPQAAPDLATQGSTAGTSFTTGFGTAANGATLVATITTQITAAIGQFDTSGRAAGTKWAGGFYTSVETGMTPQLIGLLTTLVTPGVLAALQAGQSQTGAQP